MLPPLSIYIHWPFCKSKCPYCDFNSHVRDGVDQDRWRQALLKELAAYIALLPPRRVVSIFFGGGTPSLMEPATAGALLDSAAALWPHDANVEITLEANPTSVERTAFAALRTAGVNRVSLGVQSLYAEPLKFLGRQHSADDAKEAIALAQKLFPRMSFDLIYARPGQSLAAWEAELNEALALARGHLSLYQLTIEENTAFFAAHKRGEFVMPEEELAASMYELTAAALAKHNMHAYEISNYARAGDESHHNLAYWRGDDYIGIGPGAHGRWRNAENGAWIATENIKSPERWLDAVERAKPENTGRGVQSEIVVTPQERTHELLMMGLRLTSGIDYADWQQRTGYNLRTSINRNNLAWMMQEGLLIADDQRLRTTARGALILNSITCKLLAAD